MKNIDEYITCRSKYFKAKRSNETWSTIQDLRGNYEKQFPNVNFYSSKWKTSLKENAELSKNVMSENSFKICNTLIPYQTIDVRLMDEHIKMNFGFIKEFNTGFVKYDFLSQILKVMSKDGN
uniref:Uncharacterized protein n=1 Tax=Schistosoma mansoni TaxID=6183 RepID=A0A5K4FFM7_SCHMA